MSVSTLVVASLVMGWFAARVRDKMTRDRAFAEAQYRVQRWGGSLHRELAAPPILRSLRGTYADFFFKPLSRDLGNQLVCWGTHASEAELLAALAGEPLHTVYLGGAENLSDRWVKAIQHPSSLETLRLDGTRVGDASLERLLAMANLSQLSLVDTRVSDMAVERLQTLPRLVKFYVGGPNIHRVRLAEALVVDASGKSASKVGPGLRLRGQIETDGTISPEGQVRVFFRDDRSLPPCSTIPYGWDTPLNGVTNSTQVAPTTSSFDLPASLSRGHTRIEVWFEADPVVCYQVGVSDVELAGSDPILDQETAP